MQKGERRNHRFPLFFANFNNPSVGLADSSPCTEEPILKQQRYGYDSASLV